MILVTGATGHIGNVLVRELAAEGRPVRALLLNGEDATSLAGIAGVERVEGDVLDPASLARAFAGVKTAFHLAGVISILPGRNEWVRRVNIEGTRNVLAAARQAGVERLVYTSSIHAIHRAPHDTIIDETVPYDPVHAISEYDRSKAEATLEVQREAARGLNAVIICPTGVIGPFDFRRSEMGELIWEMMRRRVVFLVNGMYDFVDVRDVARGLMRAAERGRCGESYILSGHQVSIPSILDLVKKAAGVRPLGVQVPLGLAEMVAPVVPWFARLLRRRPLFTPYSLATIKSNSAISSAKARCELGYQARSTAETLRDTVAWWLSQKAALNAA